MSSPATLIACSIFKDELTTVLNSDMRIIWLDAALHADPDEMEQQLCRAAREAGASANDAPQPQLFIGCGCHPDMAQLARRCNCKPAPFANCIAALAGHCQRKLEDNNAMLITPGWVREWPGRLSAAGWDTTEMRIQHGRFDRIILLEPGINPVSEEEILELFDLIKVPIEVVPLDLDYFTQTVRNIIDCG
ncbi:MAG: DUF1638 domain-containing protein [Deltaproteobacteria bacterium]|nr:DUF1638 domain-containing protein [Deltaproteobacteria bacterium]